MNIYDVSIPTFQLTLKNLKGILEKGAAHAEARKFDPAVLINSRMYPDMLPFNRQIQIASDAAKGAAARLTGAEPPKFPDTETTFPELTARIERTIDYLAGFKATDFDGCEERIVTVPTRNGPVSFPGLIFLRHWALPNFFFHVTTAYDLLRHNGVEIGKADYLGRAQ